MSLGPKKLTVYLCDLTYDTIILVSDTIPINIGFIGSYMKKIFGNQIEIILFKYPETVIKAIKNIPPDIICLSNYSWNSNLSEYLASVAKKFNPNVITTQGGTNFPHQQDLQLKFLSERPATDIYTVLEGEKSCSNIVQRVIDCERNRNKIFDKPIDGCVFIHPNSKNLLKKDFLVGQSLERIKDLDEVPSPYLTGILDKFFDGKLTPFIETNRGCPFTCSFCHTGSDYFHKLNKFSSKRIKDEIDYIGKKAGKLSITNLHMADVNFGMYPQDRQVCQWLLESKEKYGWPLQVMSTTGKNSKKRVIEITSILGNMFSVNMSLQSMDDQVLKNIKRSNIKLDHMIEVNDHLIKEGRSTKAELIMPLPGESKNSFIRGLDSILNSNAPSITIYTLMMLHGTEFKSPEYRDKFKYKGKYRIVPLNFGEYNGKRVFDYEEVGVETKNLSFNDYLFLRGLALLVETLHNGRPFNEFFKYAKFFNIQPASLLKTIYENISKAPKEVQQVMINFSNETKGELWNSEEELVKHYKKDENYYKLKNGLVGGNLIFKYKSISLVNNGLNWINFFEKQLYETVTEKQKNIISTEEIKQEISDISKFCKLKINGLLKSNADIKPTQGKFKFDILKWIDEGCSKRLKDYKLEANEQVLVFEFTQDQLNMRNDFFKRYGTDINSLSKIVTRISNLEGQFRKVRYQNDLYLRDIYKKIGDNFVKYALSN